MLLLLSVRPNPNKDINFESAERSQNTKIKIMIYYIVEFWA